MILIEKIIELNSKLHIDSWYDKYSQRYVTQVKDNEDNEIEYAYADNSKDRNNDIEYLKNKYKNEDIVEYYQKKKKKKKELPMTGLSPIMPDYEKGIETFNKNSSNVDTGDSVSDGSGSGIGD